MAYNGIPYGGRPNYAAPVLQTPTAKPLPKDYVNEAERIIHDSPLHITTSKLRNLMALVIEPYNEALRMSGDTLSDAQKAAMQSARIRMVYECARDDDVKAFINKTDLLCYLLDIGASRQKLMDYYHYMEALVAYARYWGKADGGK